MSAFFVSRDHIDAVVTAALYGPASGPGLNWVPMVPPELKPKSPADEDLADGLGRRLWTENARSIDTRYGDAADAYAIAAEYTYKTTAPRRPAVEGIKLAQCLRYQCCEHKDWKDSPCDRFISRLINALTHYVEGYASAPWSI